MVHWCTMFSSWFHVYNAAESAHYMSSYSNLPHPLYSQRPDNWYTPYKPVPFSSFQPSVIPFLLSYSPILSCVMGDLEITTLMHFISWLIILYAIISQIILYLSFLFWLTSLSMASSNSNQITQIAWLHHSLQPCNIYCMNILHLHNPLIHLFEELNWSHILIIVLIVAMTNGFHGLFEGMLMRPGNRFQKV